MRQLCSFIIIILFPILLITGCVVGPLPDGKAKGELEFDFDLSYPASKGFAIDKVKVTLTHQVTGKVVEEYLTVDPLNNHASGTISKLRVGWWDLLVELYELGIVVGSGEEEVEIRAGETTRVEIRMRLETGDVEIIVEWGDDEPDISVLPLNIDFGDVLVGESSSAVEVRISNNGTTDLQVNDIYIEDTGNFVLDVNGGTDPVGTSTPVILPGENGTVTVTFTPQITAIVNAKLLITSNDPDTATFAVVLVGTGIEVNDLPDLEPLNFNSPSNTEPGEEIGLAVSLDVKNSGMDAAVAADGFITIGFYLSSDEEWSGDDVILTNGNVELETPIATGETRSVSIPANMAVPAGIANGVFYILAVVDTLDEVYENSETNNIASHSISINANTLTVGIKGASDYAGYTFYFVIFNAGDDPYVDEPIALGYSQIDGNGEGSSLAQNLMYTNIVLFTFEASYDVYGLIDVTDNFDPLSYDTYEPEMYFDLEGLRTIQIPETGPTTMIFDYSSEMQISGWIEDILIGYGHLPADQTGETLWVYLLDEDLNSVVIASNDIDGDGAVYGIYVGDLIKDPDNPDFKLYYIAALVDADDNGIPEYVGWYGYPSHNILTLPPGPTNVDISKIHQWTFRFNLYDF